MNNTNTIKQRILEEFDKKFGHFTVPALVVYPGTNAKPHEEFSDKEIKSFIHTEILNEKDKIELQMSYVFMEKTNEFLRKQREKFEELIIDEILICHHENTPTSRLTSLMMKLKNLQS